jgi:hypothetical protein
MHLATPPIRPRPISSVRWRSFIKRRRLLIEIRASLEDAERDWDADRDMILAELAHGAEIEASGRIV